MAIVKINPIKIEGRWNSGVALDLHTTSSTPIGYNEFGYMQFDTPLSAEEPGRQGCRRPNHRDRSQLPHRTQG